MTLHGAACSCPACGREFPHPPHPSTYWSSSCWCLKHVKFRGYPDNEWWYARPGDGVILRGQPRWEWV